RRSRELLEKCIRIREELGLHAALISPLSNIAAIDEQTGRFAAAVEVAHKVRRLSAVTGDTVRGKSAPLWLAPSSIRLGRYGEPLRQYRIKLFYQLDDRSERLTAMLGLTRARLEQGSMSVALGRRYLTSILASTIRQRLLPLEAET